MDSNGLISALERSGMTVTPEVASVFQLFEGPHCNENYAIMALCQVLKRIWSKLLFDTQRGHLLDLVLKTLTKGREGRNILSRFLPSLEDAFALQSIYLPDINRYIAAWGMVHVW